MSSRCADFLKEHPRGTVEFFWPGISLLFWRGFPRSYYEICSGCWFRRWCLNDVLREASTWYPPNTMWPSVYNVRYCQLIPLYTHKLTQQIVSVYFSSTNMIIHQSLSIYIRTYVYTEFWSRVKRFQKTILNFYSVMQGIIKYLKDYYYIVC